MKVCDELPVTVEMVTLRLDGHRRSKLPATHAGKPPFSSTLCLLYVGLHATLLTCASAGFRRTSKEIDEVRRAAEMLSILRKRILRRIPDVQTEFGGWEYDHMIPEEKDTIRRAWEEDIDIGNGVGRRAIWDER